MDIGTIVSWIQVVLWLVAVVLWGGRIVRGEAQLPLWTRKLFSSNALIMTVIFLGLTMSGMSLYMTHAAKSVPDSVNLNISVYNPPTEMRIVSDKTFEDQQVPLDGIIYERCTFVNVCFLYTGGAFGLQNCTAKKSWKVCVKDGPLYNYEQLLDSLKMLAPHARREDKDIAPR